MLAGVEECNAKIRSSHNASNLYTHFRAVHSDIYSVLIPIIEGKEKNKQTRTIYITLDEVQNRRRKTLVEDAILFQFSAPDVPKALLLNSRFKNLMNALNPSFKIPTLCTLNARLWQQFHKTINDIKSDIAKREHIVITFDGWASVRNERVIGFIVSFLDENLELKNRCIGNFKVSTSHFASDIAGIISEVIRDRIGSRKPSYFVTDSAPISKAAVRIFMGDSGYESSFPCAVHFVHLAMREARSGSGLSERLKRILAMRRCHL